MKESSVLVSSIAAGILMLAACSLSAQPVTFSEDIPTGTVPVVKGKKQAISTSGGSFVDATGRTMFLRGVNLGGSTKVPFTPNLGTHVKEGFFEGTAVSFVGRPFPLEEADRHFERLRSWGFHFLRFLVTWEAIEHEGPGIYDAEYLEYVRSIVAKAGEYGINVMIDPHQDVWSRYTGGDGAPLWTFEVAGMDVTKFQETGAAMVHNVYGDPFPQMIWYTNYYKLGAATMFTLFFGGNDFAPRIRVASRSVQDYLQEHYIDALAQVARAVADLPNVVGFELMNEPSSGYIGIKNIGEAWHTEIIGDAPTPYQGMLLGDGISQSVQRYRLGAVALKEDGRPVMNQNGTRVWKDKKGIWQQHGVWEMGTSNEPQLLDSTYFSRVKGQPVNFNTMYYEPFARKYAETIRAINPDWFICVDNVLFPYPQALPELKKYPETPWVNGSHWYDDVTLVKKKYLPFLGLKDGEVVFGKRNVRSAFETTLATMISETHEQYGDAPTLLGEFGIPFDLNKGKAYETGNFKKQNRALDRCFQVAEHNLLNYTLWNYTADNTNERGDQWNGEDLSIYSLSQQELYAGINAGGRALEAAIRPYPRKVAGKLTRYSYDYETGTLTIEFENKTSGDYPTEIFLPEFVYGEGFAVNAEKSRMQWDGKEQILMYYPEGTGMHTLTISAR